MTAPGHLRRSAPRTPAQACPEYPKSDRKSEPCRLSRRATTGCEQVQQYACRAARKQTQQNRRIGEYDGLADEGLAELGRRGKVTIGSCATQKITGFDQSSGIADQPHELKLCGFP